MKTSESAPQFKEQTGREEEEREKKKIKLRVVVSLYFRAVQDTEEQNVIRIIMTSKGFHHSVTVRMPTRSMVHETASFYWHGIQSAPLGYMSLAFAVGAAHYGAPRTCQHPTTQSLLMPPLLTSSLA